MKYAVAALALAAGVSANYPVSPVLPAANATTSTSSEVSYTTEVITDYVTYCPEATTLTYGTQTHVVTSPGTITLPNYPVTHVTPISVTSTVICNECSTAPAYPTIPAGNTTVATTYHPTGGVPPAPTYPGVPPTAGAGKVAAGMAGVLAAVVAAL